MSESTLIFTGNQERPSSHCASIAELPTGELYAVWYAGSHEADEDVAIVASRLPSGGTKWTPVEVLVDPPGRAGGNPVVWVDGSGVLHHFYDIIEDPERGWSGAVLYRDRSGDGGWTWEGAEVFDDEPGMMVRHRPVRLRAGRVLLPAYDEKSWEGLCYISDDDGVTWRRGGRIVCDGGCIQPAIIERDDGTLHALLRCAEGGYAWESDSTDGGESWSPCVRSRLRNPNSGADMIRLRSGEVAACFNDAPDRRTPLIVAVSLDEGRTWAGRYDVETGEGEFSYPTLMQASDGTVHLVYTWRRRGIVHVRMTPQWLRRLAAE